MAIPPPRPDVGAGRSVKWLTRKEQLLLLNVLGGPSDDEALDDPGEEDEPGSWKGGLFGDERFDLAFSLSLLRADVFGAAQASVVARLRKRSAADAAIAQAIAPIDDGAYAAAAAAYAELLEQLRLESRAALAVLMEAGAPEPSFSLTISVDREPCGPSSAPRRERWPRPMRTRRSPITCAATSPLS